MPRATTLSAARQRRALRTKQLVKVCRTVAESLERRLLLSTVTWTGPATGGDWDTPGNWSGNAVPAPSQDVSIPSGVSVNHATGAADSVNSISASGATINLSAGGISVAATSTLKDLELAAGATLAVTGGRFNVASGSSAGAFNVSAGATLAFDGVRTNFQAKDGTSWQGAGLYYVTSTVTLADAAVLLKPVQLQLIGTLAGSGTVEIPSGGNFFFDGNTEQFTGTSGHVGPELTGSGTLKLDAGATGEIGSVFSGGGGNLIDGWNFDNAGTVTLNSAVVSNGINTSHNANSLFKNEPTGLVEGQVGASAFLLAFNNAGTVENLSGAGALSLGFNNSDGSLTNSGTVDAQGTSAVHLGTASNTGSITAESGASVIFDGATVTFHTGSTLNGTGTFDAQGKIILADAGLVLSPANFSSEYFVDGPGSLTQTPGSNWTFNGVLEAGATLNVQHGATLTIGPEKAGQRARVDDATLNNDGTIALNQADLTTISTKGVINNKADGVFNATGTGGDYSVAANPFNNAGTFTSDSGLNAQHTNNAFGASELNNTGVVSVKSGLLALGDSANLTSSSTVLTGGTWNVLNGAEISTPSNGFGIVQNNATVTLSGAGSKFDTFTGLMTNSGSLSVLAGATLATQPFVDPDSGTMTPTPFTNSGTLTIGVGSTVTPAGSFTQTSAGTLISQIGDRPGNNGFGQLVDLSYAAHLDGTLQASLVNNFSPVAGDVYPILTFGSETGNFAAFSNVSPLFAPHLNATNYTLTAGTVASVADLSVSGVTATGPGASQPGQPLDVGYTVTNLSAGVTDATSWEDSVYLSPTSTFYASTASLLGRLPHTGGLGGNGFYTNSASFVTPGVAPGNYFVLVVGDSRDQVTDPNRTNNRAASAALSLQPPSLAIGSSVSGTVDNGQFEYYRLDVPGGSPVTLTLTTPAAGGAELLTRFASLPTLADFDQYSFDPTKPAQTITLDGSKPGTYYVLVHGRTGCSRRQVLHALRRLGRLRPDGCFPVPRLRRRDRHAQSERRRLRPGRDRQPDPGRRRGGHQRRFGFRPGQHDPRRHFQFDGRGARHL